MILGPVAVLHGVEGAVHRAQVPVADPLGIGERILVEAALPEPLPVELARVGKVLHRKRQRPRRGGEGLWCRGLGPGPHVAHPHPPLLLHHRLGAGEVAERGMAGGVAEEGAGDGELAAGVRVEAGDGGDPARLGRRREGVGIEEQVDGRLGADERLLLRVLELLRGARALRRPVGELLDDLADPRILPAPDQPHRPDPDLARAVAAEHRPVLDEGHLEPHPRRGERRPHAGVAAADHHQVVGTLDLRFGREAERGAAPRGEDGRVVGRGSGGRAGGHQGDAVAAAVEAGEVAEGEGHGAGRQRDGTAVLPAPRGGAGAEGRGQCRAADHDLEPPRRIAGSAPAGDPVLRADEHPVVASGRHVDRGGGVGHRATEAVGEQIRGAHLGDELGVERPAPVISEALRFDEDRDGGLSGHGAGAKQCGNPGEVDDQDARAHGGSREG